VVHLIDYIIKSEKGMPWFRSISLESATVPAAVIVVNFAEFLIVTDPSVDGMGRLSAKDVSQKTCH
jgi:hypothetical protein